MYHNNSHKTLRGPRAGLIFFNKTKESDIEKRINDAVFPACQGGPHNNVSWMDGHRFCGTLNPATDLNSAPRQTIAGVAVALKQVSSQAFKDYAAQIIANTKTIAKSLMAHDYKLQTNGSENHLVLWDLRPLGLSGSKIEKICDLAHITLNKNSVPGDKSAMVPGGVRVGTNALTSRSMKEPEMETVADFLHRAVQIAVSVLLSLLALALLSVCCAYSQFSSTDALICSARPVHPPHSFKHRRSRDPRSSSTLSRRLPRSMAPRAPRSSSSPRTSTLLLRSSLFLV